MGLCKIEEKSPPSQRIFCFTLKCLFLDMLILMEYTSILHISLLQELQIIVIFIVHYMNIFFWFLDILIIFKNHFSKIIDIMMNF